jgi:hypothetical protein
MRVETEVEAAPPSGDEVVSLTLDRESRGRIRSLAFFAALQPALSDLWDIETVDDSNVPAHAQRLRTIMDLFEQLGWQCATDQQEFHLTGSRAALIDLLTSMERDAARSLERAIRDLRYGKSTFGREESGRYGGERIHELLIVSNLLDQVGARWREKAAGLDWASTVRSEWGAAGGAVYDRLHYEHPFVSCSDLVGMTREALEEEGAIETVAA